MPPGPVICGRGTPRACGRGTVYLYYNSPLLHSKFISLCYFLGIVMPPVTIGVFGIFLVDVHLVYHLGL